MANAWIAHVKKTKEMYPQIMQKGGLKAIILKAKETYKKQSGGSGHPMGGKVETMVDQGADVAGVSMGRAVGAGAHENAKLENAHTMGGGKKGKRGGDNHEGPEDKGGVEDHDDEGHDDKGDDVEGHDVEGHDVEDHDVENKGVHSKDEDKETPNPTGPFGGKKSKKGKKTKKAKKSKKSKTAKKGGKKTKKVKKAKKAKKAKKTRSRK